MIATKEPTKNPKSGVIHIAWVKKQTLLCLVGKKYDWGYGLTPVRQDAELFYEGAKMLRVNAQNVKRFESELRTGEYWLVVADGYHFKEGDTVKGCLVVHVEGRLLRKATEAEIDEIKAEVREEKLNAELANEELLLSKLPERRRSENKRYALEVPVQDTVWTVGKLLKWKDRDGNEVFGYKLDRKDEAIFAEVLPEKEKVFRLEAKSVPVKTGQRWNISVNSLHYTEDDVDPKGNAVIYVEGELVSEAKAEVKKEFVQRRKVDSVAVKNYDSANFIDVPPDEEALPEKKHQKGKKAFRKGESHDSTWREVFGGIDLVEVRALKNSKREHRERKEKNVIEE